MFAAEKDAYLQCESYRRTIAAELSRKKVSANRLANFLQSPMQQPIFSAVPSSYRELIMAFAPRKS